MGLRAARSARAGRLARAPRAKRRGSFERSEKGEGRRPETRRSRVGFGVWGLGFLDGVGGVASEASVGGALAPTCLFNKPQ